MDTAAIIISCTFRAVYPWFSTKLLRGFGSALRVFGGASLALLMSVQLIMASAFSLDRVIGQPAPPVVIPELIHAGGGPSVDSDTG